MSKAKYLGDCHVNLNQNCEKWAHISRKIPKMGTFSAKMTCKNEYEFCGSSSRHLSKPNLCIPGQKLM